MERKGIKDHSLFNRLYQLGARVICISRPGYGLSTPYTLNNIGEWGDIVAYLVEELRLPQIDVLGMFSGEPYSYSIGRAFPDKVRNINIFSGKFLFETVSFFTDPIFQNAVPICHKLRRLAERITGSQQ